MGVADRVASYFVPAIIMLAVCAFVLWYVLADYGFVETTYHPFTFALLFSLTILVISCPCAVSLAVPTVVIVATGVAAKHGILFKGGAAIEKASKSKVCVFDKTGTLTQGCFSVTNFELDSNCKYDEKSLFQLIGSLESSSEHLIGKAIVERADELGCSLIESSASFIAIPGNGIQGRVDSTEVCLGNFSWVLAQCQNVSEELRDDFTRKAQLWQVSSQTVIAVAVNEKLVALLGLSDSVRSEASFVIAKLKEMNKKVFMLTGDQKKTALAIGGSLGLSEENIISEVRPEEKADTIKELQEQYGSVVMIGDGVNDAIALAAADIGIAIGSGTNVAIEAADIVLMKSDLWDIIILHLSNVAFKVIKLNFGWAFFYNLVGIPLAAGALYPIWGIAIPPALAGFSELLSSLPVVFFALIFGRLYKAPTHFQLS